MAEELFVKLRMWAEIDDDGSIANVRYKYKLPKIDSDLVIELYGIFLNTLCGQLASLEGSENLQTHLERVEIIEETDED